MTFEFPTDIPTELRDSFNSLNFVSPSSDLLATSDYKTVSPEALLQAFNKKGPLRYEIIYEHLFPHAMTPIRAIGLELDGSIKFIPLSSDKFSRYGLFLRKVVQHHRALIVDGVVKLYVFN